VNEQHREYAEKYGSMSSAGYANGYVAIPKEHPLYGISYNDVDVDVHGGLTFAEKSEVVNDLFDKNKTEYLESELPNGYWVFGFDTMHFMDNLDNCPREWCIAETNRLKQQLENWEE
jgi:hypothetical protein